MNCKYHKIRTHKGVKFGYCTLYRKEVPLFGCKCNELILDNLSKKYEKTNKYTNQDKKPLKIAKNGQLRANNKSYKIKKLENNRFSILTNDLTKCYCCPKPKQHLHEVYEGIYRNRSMEYGCVLPLCNDCHIKIHHDAEFKLYYKRLMESQFKKTYPNLNFNELFYYKDLSK